MNNKLRFVCKGWTKGRADTPQRRIIRYCAIFFFQKTAKNSKFMHGNFPNERVDQEKHFYRGFGVVI